MDVVSDEALLNGGVQDNFDECHLHPQVCIGDILLPEPSGVSVDGVWCYIGEEDVTTSEEGAEFLHLVFAHAGGGVAVILAELIDGLLAEGEEGG